MATRANLIVRMIKAEPIGIVSLVIGIATIAFAYMTYSQQGTNNTWTVIASHAPGNSGLKGAMEYLHQKKKSLQDIDLRPISEAYAEVSGIHHANINFAKLKGIDLSYAWLDRTDFSSADLTDSTLDFVRMTYSKLNNALLANASLNGAILQQTSWRGTKATCLEAHGLDLTYATIGNSKLDASDMKEVVLNNARIIHSSFVGVDFSNGFLPGSTFLDVNLMDAKFSETELSQMKIYGANISGADFSTADGIDTVMWSDVWAWSDKIPTFPEGTKPEYKIYKNTCRSGSWLKSKPPLDESCLITDVTDLSEDNLESLESYFLNDELCEISDRKSMRRRSRMK